MVGCYITAGKSLLSFLSRIYKLISVALGVFMGICHYRREMKSRMSNQHDSPSSTRDNVNIYIPANSEEFYPMVTSKKVLRVVTSQARYALNSKAVHFIMCFLFCCFIGFIPYAILMAIIALPRYLDIKNLEQLCELKNFNM